MSKMMLKEGIHTGLPEADYHQDPAIEPSASSGVLKLLLERSPEHAWTAHPRLNPDWVEKPSGTDAQNRGTILHALTLGTDAQHRVLGVDNFKTKDAQALRDATIAAGLIPVKAADMEELEDAAASIRARLQAMPEVWAAMQDAVAEKMTEATLIWREGDVLCRCRYDTLPSARFKISYDLKFTGLSAEPNEFGKKVIKDHSIQSELYPRAVETLRGDRPLFAFVCAEWDEPYGVSLHALDPEAQDQAQQQVDEALATWSHCRRTGKWPSYPSLIHYHTVKPWQKADWAERQGMAAYARRLMKEKPTREQIDAANHFMLAGAEALR